MQELIKSGNRSGPSFVDFIRSFIGIDINIVTSEIIITESVTTCLIVWNGYFKINIISTEILNPFTYPAMENFIVYILR